MNTNEVLDAAWLCEVIRQRFAAAFAQVLDGDIRVHSWFPSLVLHQHDAGDQ